MIWYDYQKHTLNLQLLIVCLKLKHNLVRADHPNNIKRGRVCIYFKESLLVWVISLPYLNQALFLKMTYNIKKVIVFVIYRSRRQNNNEFELFLSNFEQLLNDVSKRKPSLSVITGILMQDLPHGGLEIVLIYFTK